MIHSKACHSAGRGAGRCWPLAPFTVALLAGLLLCADVFAQDGTVLSHQKISDTQGGFTGTLDNSDLLGDAVAALGDLDGDGFGDLAVGADGDDDGGSARGAVWVLFLDADGTVSAEQKISDTQGGFTGALGDDDYFGGAVASLGDLDGDGVGDLAVGASQDDDGGSNRGAVWILFLNTDGTVKAHQKISDTEGGFTGTLIDQDRFGSSLASLSDLDGDGVADLAVGEIFDDFIRGAVWVLFLNADGTVKAHQKISSSEGGFSGTLDASDGFGSGLSSLEDLDGNGVRDLAVGAYGDDDGGTDRGAVWILFLNANGTVNSHQKISDTVGGFTGTLLDSDKLGIAVSSLGDLDGDGVQDLAAGASWDDDGGGNRGALWVLFLNADGTVKGHQKISDTQGGFTGTLDNNDRFGTSIAWLGDQDGDGLGDAAVGARLDGDGGSARGAVWTLFLEGAPTCGSGILDPHEECDDGNTTDFDGCSGVCRMEDRFALEGTAQGGSVDVTVEGVLVSVTTSAGETSAQVLAALAAAINADSTLSGLGVTAQPNGNVLVVVGGTITDVTISDAGLSFPGTVLSHQKISDTQGGFTGTLDLRRRRRGGKR